LSLFLRLFLSGVFLAAVGAAQTIPGPIENDDKSELDAQPVRAFFTSVRQLLNQEDFNQLEQIAAEARSTKARFTGGDWKLEAFYRVVQGPGTLTAPDVTWTNHIERLKRWAAAKPESVTPRIAIGSAYLRFAWKARGNGFSDTVTADAEKLFSDRVAQARLVLEEAELLPIKDPELYCRLQTVALAQGWSRPNIDRLLYQVQLTEPAYFRIYTEQANFLMPKWYGQPGDAEAFAQNAADKIGGDEGNYVYFRIALEENCCHSTQLPGLAWNRVKLGFAALESLYGSTNFQRNAMALMAVNANDGDLARQLFARIGNDWASGVWGSKGKFEKIRFRFAASAN
jgi:hypothetical protein